MTRKTLTVISRSVLAGEDPQTVANKLHLTMSEIWEANDFIARSSLDRVTKP